MVVVSVGYENGIGLSESGIVNLHIAHPRNRVHLNDISVIFKGKGAMENAGHAQRFPGRGSE